MTSLDDQLDSTTRFPEWVNKRIHENEADPVMAALKTLPENRKANVMRQLEHALHQEDLKMTEEERVTWMQRAELIIPHDYVKVHVKYESSYTYRDHNFRTVEEAAQFLHTWVKKWSKTHKGLICKDFNVTTIDSLRQLVFQRQSFTLESDKYNIYITFQHKYFSLKTNEE